MRINEKFWEYVGAAAFVPILALNALGGIVGGVWLVVIGRWSITISAFFATLIFPWIFSILFAITGMPLGMLVGFFAKKRQKILTMIFGYLAILVGHIISLAWVFLSYVWILSLADLQGSMVPYLLVGFAMATSPFTYMARGEPADAAGTNITLFIVHTAALAWGVSFLIAVPVLSLLATLLVLATTIFMQVYLLKRVSAEYNLAVLRDDIVSDTENTIEEI